MRKPGDTSTRWTDAAPAPPTGRARPVYNRARYRNLMSDRKYRQRGYQDNDRDRPATPRPQRPAPEPGAPAGARRISQDGPRNINMPGYREVVRCAQCGTVVSADVGLESRCTAVRHRPARLRAVHVVRSGQPIRVHAVDPGTDLAKEREELVHAVHGPDDRRAGNDGATPRRRAEGVRRPVQVGTLRHGAAF